jgi:hypothetical protein
MKILKIHFQHLRNEAHYQLLLLVQKLFGNYPAVAALVTDLLTPFFDLLTLEGQLVDAVRGSVYTEELAEADRRVDRDVAGINAAVASALHHFDPALVAAAKYVEIRLKFFHGEIEKKAYEEESAAVKILVTDLQGEYAEQVAILSLGPWVAELAAAQEDFERIFLLRSDKRATQPKERLRDVRKQIDAVYRQIVDRIDAYTLLNGDSVTGLFIEHLNDEITYFNEHDHRHARKDIDHAVVASIPDQPWKGKTVIVLPEVTYEGKELVFTKDYELSYHDNDRPGNAYLIIHGKGAWKGTKTVSFNIVVND